MQVNSFPSTVPHETRLSFMADRAKRLMAGACEPSVQREFDALALVPMEERMVGHLAARGRDSFALNR